LARLPRHPREMSDHDPLRLIRTTVDLVGRGLMSGSDLRSLSSSGCGPLVRERTKAGCVRSRWSLGYRFAGGRRRALGSASGAATYRGSALTALRGRHDGWAVVPGQSLTTLVDRRRHEPCS
jgi:hypothetical protein